MTDPLERTIQDQGRALHLPWPSLGEYVDLQPGTTINVFSAPGVGKSMWALNLAYSIPAPVLYVNLDTPLIVQAVRVWAHIGGATIHEVKENPRRYMYKARWHPNGNVHWSDVHMKIEQLSDLTFAIEEYAGMKPQVVILDSMGNVVPAWTYEGFTQAFETMKDVAKQDHSTVISIHHAQKVKRANKPVYLSDVEYAGGKQPDIVLGMYKPSPRFLRVEILKNRLGESDPSGRLYVDLRVDYQRARVLDA